MNPPWSLLHVPISILPLLLILGLTASPAPAQTPELNIEAGGSYSDLDNNFEDWNKQYVDVSYPTGLRSGLYGSVTRTDWFDETDAELSTGVYGPLRANMDGSLELAYSPTHEVAQELYTRGQVSYWLGNGWELQNGIQYSDYSQGDDSTGLIAGVRYYRFPYWTGYTYTPSWLGGGGPANSHTFSAGYSGPNHNSFGISTTIGESNTEVAAGQVRQEDVTSLTAWGEQPLTANASLTLQASWNDIDNLYDRASLQGGFKMYF